METKQNVQNMNDPTSPLRTLNQVLSAAEHGSYAVGAFAPRTTAMIQPILCAGQAARSPLIVQISQKELTRYQITPSRFAEEFFAQLESEHITVPVVLHLDHTKEISIIQDAIAAGFTSVMIDASEKPLDENIAISRKVVEYAHARAVSVEAELGRIGTTDFVETESDEELYTKPEEAERFVRETGVDALAVSVGTAHGVYTVRQPKIDLPRLRAIRALTPVHLVLHGGSGVPAEMMQAAIQLEGGGVSKVNIATDLELAALGALGRDHHLTDSEMNVLSPEEITLARAAVEQTVTDKITNFLRSNGKTVE
ncbi:MAG TPA: class II fructose-bisphosphate aldolase [Anaerolineales bacterium]|nr:class II fructose-bisphosphate aldolase [Anaerolineales bacterium]